MIFPPTKATPEQIAINEAAVVEIKTLFPTMPDNELHDWLMACTAYPFQMVSECMDNIRDLAKRSSGDWNAAIEVAMSDFENDLRQSKLKESNIEALTHELAEAFIQWPLPESVSADLIATKLGEKGRIGTNLLSYIEAKQMMEEVVIKTLRAKGLC